MTRQLCIALAAATLALPAFFGCHTEEPRSPTVGLTKPISPPEMPPLGNLPATVEIDGPYSMYVTESVQHFCAGPDPFFHFDSANPTARDEPTMKNLVDCMSSGALRGKSIKLIGHTDPRGTAEYNEKLGLERAEKVKHYLVTKGIDQARVQTGSTGKEDASDQPRDWGKDRRVEIQLVK